MRLAFALAFIAAATSICIHTSPVDFTLHKIHFPDAASQPRFGDCTLPSRKICTGPLPVARWEAVVQKFAAADRRTSFGRWIHDVGNSLALDGGIDVSSRTARLFNLPLNEPNAATFGPIRLPFYFEPNGNVRISSLGEPGSESHPGQFIYVAATLGTSLNQTIGPPDQRFALSDAMATMLRDCHSDKELEFIAICGCAYGLLDLRWTTRQRTSISGETLIRELLRKPISAPPCMGAHRMQAIAAAKCAEAVGVRLSPDLRSLVQSELSKAIGLLERNQGLDGSWGSHWAMSFSDPGDCQACRLCLAGRDRGRVLRVLSLLSNRRLGSVQRDEVKI